MPEKIQTPMNPLLPIVPVAGGPAVNGADEDELARQELARLTPSNEQLLKIAAQSGPLPKWLDEDEPSPF